MTWKEFKEAVERQGVLNTDEVFSIDFYTHVDPLEVIVHKDEEGIMVANVDDLMEVEDV